MTTVSYGRKQKKILFLSLIALSLCVLFVLRPLLTNVVCLSGTSTLRTSPTQGERNAEPSPYQQEHEQQEQQQHSPAVLDRQQHIEELLSHVEDYYKEMCRDILQGKAMSFAQAWQDWMIYHNYFRDRQWGDGFYLDIGANDAVFISNTLFFDKCLGWRGICAEPQKQYHAGIRSKRSCELLPTCVLGKDTRVRTSLSGVDFAVNEAKEGQAGTMECVGIESLKRKYGFETIDLVSIDIEGAEPSVLSCWPFETVNTTMFLVETNKLDSRMVDFFFHRHGYMNEQSFPNVAAPPRMSWLDNLYVKKDKGEEFAHPPIGSNFSCTPLMRKFRGQWCHAFAVKAQSPEWFRECAV